MNNAPPPAPPTTKQPEMLVVGRLVAAQGLGGDLRVLPLSDFPERFTRPGARWLRRKSDPPLQVRLRSGRQLPGRELFVVRLEGIDNRTAAEALVGHELLVPASERPRLEPGEFHLLDLVGLEVRLLVNPTPDHPLTTQAVGDAGELGHAEQVGDAAPPSNAPTASIGRVLDLIHAGNDLLEVELTGSGSGGPRRRVLIPFVEAIVPEVNLAGGWIGLTPPPGLLEL